MSTPAVIDKEAYVRAAWERDLSALRQGMKEKA